MNRHKINLVFFVLLYVSLVIVPFSLSMNVSTVASLRLVNAQDQHYYVQLTAADEDYVNFTSMAGFTTGKSWTIVQRIKLPEDPTIFGWSWFRGSAWEDKEGDMALQIDTNVEHDYQVYFWVRKDYAWNTLQMNRSQNGLTFQNNTWYDIAIVFDRPTTTYKLYVEGALTDSLVLAEMNDTNNNNPLFFGGQYCTPGHLQGDLYTECDTAIAHQAWFQRALSSTEIENYNGTVNNTDEDLFFATEITASEILDASGNGRNGINGNSPEYILYTPSSSEKTGFPPVLLICYIGISLMMLLLWKKRKQ